MRDLYFGTFAVWGLILPPVLILYTRFTGYESSTLKILRAFLQKAGEAVFELNYLRSNATFQH